MEEITLQWAPGKFPALPVETSTLQFETTQFHVRMNSELKLSPGKSVKLLIIQIQKHVSLAFS
jgi:hypothetical protein